MKTKDADAYFILLTRVSFMKEETFHNHVLCSALDSDSGGIPCFHFMFQFLAPFTVVYLCEAALLNTDSELMIAVKMT